MADRTSAKAFGEIVEALAKNHENHSNFPERQDAIRECAALIWKVSESLDFTADQMGCPDALEELSLFDGSEYAPYK